MISQSFSQQAHLAGILYISSSNGAKRMKRTIEELIEGLLCLSYTLTDRSGMDCEASR